MAAIPVQSTLDAIRLTGCLEGMIIGPVCEGESMAGHIDLVRTIDTDSQFRHVFVTIKLRSAFAASPSPR